MTELSNKIQLSAKRYEYIDSLRGIAILLVILVHTGAIITDAMPSEPKILAQLIADGRFGVQLFFVVSAFTLIVSHNNRKNENNFNTNFFIRRFFRIAPLYYLMTVLVLIDQVSGFESINLHIPPVDVNIFREFLSHILFINSIFPNYIIYFTPGGWSISVEFLFYLFVPLICCYINNINRCLNFTLASLLICFIINKFLSIYTSNPVFFYYNFINQFPVFTFGFLAYFIVKEKDRFKVQPLSIILLIANIIIFYH